jgi:hypothetical protein
MATVGGLIFDLRNRLMEPLLNQYHRELEWALRGPFTTLLDVGCGPRSPLAAVPHSIARTVGAEIYEPALRESARQGIHSEYVLMDVKEILQSYGCSSFDVVLASDVIEHFERGEADSLIRAMEHVARKRVIIMTPNGFQAQGAREGNPFQVHRSGWTVGDMRARGYSSIVGINGWRPLRGETTAIRWRPHLLWDTVSLLSQTVVRKRPVWAYQIMCVKDFRPK